MALTHLKYIRFGAVDGTWVLCTRPKVQIFCMDHVVRYAWVCVCVLSSIVASQFILLFINKHLCGDLYKSNAMCSSINAWLKLTFEQVRIIIIINNLIDALFERRVFIFVGFIGTILLPVAIRVIWPALCTSIYRTDTPPSIDTQAHVALASPTNSVTQ